MNLRGSSRSDPPKLSNYKLRHGGASLGDHVLLDLGLVGGAVRCDVFEGELRHAAFGFLRRVELEGRADLLQRRAVELAWVVGRHGACRVVHALQREDLDRGAAVMADRHDDLCAILIFVKGSDSSLELIGSIVADLRNFGVSGATRSIKHRVGLQAIVHRGEDNSRYHVLFTWFVWVVGIGYISVVWVPLVFLRGRDCLTIAFNYSLAWNSIDIVLENILAESCSDIGATFV